MADDQQNQPKRKPGRPSKDWEALFAEWLKSGLPRRDFLKLKGIDHRGGVAKKKTAHWEQAISEAKDQLNEQHLASLAGRKPRVTAVVENLIEKNKPGNQPGETAVAGIGGGTSWQMIQKWRANQANQDFKMSDQIRLHIGLLLKDGLQKRVVYDTDGKTVLREEWISVLKPFEVRSLALAAGEVQRQQRLALGLSTENIGIDALVAEANVEKADGTAKPRNLFIVEMSRNGKFVRARPRQAG